MCVKKSVIDPDVENSIIQGYNSNIRSDLHSLVIACDLKRSRKTVEHDLDKFIQALYAKLYLTVRCDPTVGIPAKDGKKVDAKYLLVRALLITRIAKDAAEKEPIS